LRGLAAGSSVTICARGNRVARAIASVANPAVRAVSGVQPTSLERKRTASNEEPNTDGFTYLAVMINAGGCCACGIADQAARLRTQEDTQGVVGGVVGGVAWRVPGLLCPAAADSAHRVTVIGRRSVTRPQFPGPLPIRRGHCQPRRQPRAWTHCLHCQLLRDRARTPTARGAEA
jgi:hypothetical protein